MNAALNVLQQGDVKTAARSGDAFNACPFVRRVDLDARQLAGGLKHCGVDGEQCPLLAKGEGQAAGIKTGEVCRLLRRQSRRFSVGPITWNAPVKNVSDWSTSAIVLAGIHHARPDAMSSRRPRIVVASANGVPRFQRHARVAGLVGDPSPQSVPRQQRVAVQPRHAGLGLRQHEAALDKALGHHVKLAMHRASVPPRESLIGQRS